MGGPPSTDPSATVAANASNWPPQLTNELPSTVAPAPSAERPADVSNRTSLDPLPSLPAPVGEAEQAEWHVAPSPRCPRMRDLDGELEDGCMAWDFDLSGRGYYLNDQRVYWSGQEATFGVEGVFAPRFAHRTGEWLVGLDCEFYLNQPFNRNRLADTAERRSYLANFDIEPFEISKLNIEMSRGDLTLKIGKMETPFGRTWFPLYTNARTDAPFIRTEAIRWRETGVLGRYKFGCLVTDVALTNGCEDLDTNSSKALVARVGLESEWGALGGSVKKQDGIGSEGQKQYNNHMGVDAMLRFGRFILSAEAIADQYGFTRPGFDPLDVTWGRSLYYRDLNNPAGGSIGGVGYYINLGYVGERTMVNLNYGEYYPEDVGVPQHDEVNRRGIVKVAYAFSAHLQSYSVLMIESDGYPAQDGRPKHGVYVLTGFQYDF